MNFTYILKCKDESLYTGWTNDVRKRMQKHCSDKGAKYTRGRGPLELVYLEALDTRQEAMRREAEIKRMTRKEKLALIAESDWQKRLAQWNLEELAQDIKIKKSS